MTYHIVTCPSCGAGNRIPADKEGRKGRCGICRAVLPAMYCHPQQLNNNSFDSFLADFPGPVLAEFWASW